MKPFNLEAAKAGAPVQTRDGRKARIVCFDRKNPYFPLVAMVVGHSELNEINVDYTIRGTYYSDQGVDDDRDLVMAPIKKDAWVNIYPSACIYDTKEEADDGAGTKRIACAHIEVEE